MDVKKIIHQSPGKTIYIEIGPQASHPHRVFHFFTDEYYCKKTHSTILMPGKGALTNRLSSLFFAQLKKWDVDTHFLWVRDMCTCVMKDMTLLPFGLRIYCKADEAMSKNFSLDVGTSFSPPLVEYVNTQEKQDMSYSLNEDFLVALQWIDEEDLEDLLTLGLRCIHGFRGFFGAKDLQLIFMDFSFGRNDHGDFTVMGHFSPETLCLQWEKDGSFWGGTYMEQEPEKHYEWFTAMFLPQEIPLRSFTPKNHDALKGEKPYLHLVSWEKNQKEEEDNDLKNNLNSKDISQEEHSLPFTPQENDSSCPKEDLSSKHQKKNPPILDNFENVVYLADFLHKEPQEEDFWF